jgi:hypothetical protein
MLRNRLSRRLPFIGSWMTPTVRLLAALAGICATGSAHAQHFEERCRALAETTSVSVVFEDMPITWDTRLRPEEIAQRSGRPVVPHHFVLGLTTAKPTARMSVKHHSLADTDGRRCVAGSLVLTLGFSEMRVYLASTLAGPCRRRIVEQHELEHVRIWREHMRVGAKLLEPVLAKALADPLYVDAGEPAERALRQHLEGIVAPLLQQLTATVDAAQREIDTPESYRSAESRYRACP